MISRAKLLQGKKLGTQRPMLCKEVTVPRGAQLRLVRPEKASKAPCLFFF